MIFNSYASNIKLVFDVIETIFYDESWAAKIINKNIITYNAIIENEMN